jgi:hypothetical protein
MLIRQITRRDSCPHLVLATCSLAEQSDSFGFRNFQVGPIALTTADRYRDSERNFAVILRTERFTRALFREGEMEQRFCINLQAWSSVPDPYLVLEGSFNLLPDDASLR